VAEAMDESIRSISSSVQAMYEAFPYPDYNLFLPLRWQEAYNCSSLFARQLLRQTRVDLVVSESRPKILIAGCGDVQSSIIGRWEPRAHQLTGIDLSSRSLQKARIRSWMMLRPMQLLQMNLENPDTPLIGPYLHIDAYGVLHHLANPAAGLRTLAQVLAPGGTMRIMVYNSRSRQWMFQLKRVFALLGLSAYVSQDLKDTRQLLELFAQKLPALQERMRAMRSIIQEPSRLVDAFFHEREARLDLSYWVKAIEQSGLESLGLLDRYAELDDLANPLLAMPALSLLEERIDDLRFENNLELYLWKNLGISSNSSTAPATYRAPFSLRRRLPPLAWFRYAETQKLPFEVKWQLWQAFLSAQHQGSSKPLDRLFKRIPEPALQRLGRMGVIFPDQLQSQALKKLLHAPMQSTMEVPRLPAPVDGQKDETIRKKFEAVLLRKKLPLARLDLIWQRLMKAQKV